MSNLRLASKEFQKRSSFISDAVRVLEPLGVSAKVAIPALAEDAHFVTHRAMDYGKDRLSDDES